MRLVFIVLLLISFSVNDSHGSDFTKTTFIKNKRKENAEIVLIFTRNELAKKHKKSAFYTLNHLKYYDDYLIDIKQNLRNEDQNDTVTIYTKKKIIPVDLFHNYITYSYHVKAGDTILFTFKNDIPLASSRKLDPESYYDLNYVLEYKKHFNQPLKSDGIFRISPDKRTVSQQVKKIKENYLAQKYFLDSLVKNKKISLEIANYYLDQNRFEFVGTMSTTPAYSSFLINETKEFNFEKLINDEHLLYHDYFNQFLIWKYLWSYRLNIKKVKHAQGLSLDYKQAYDVVKTYFSNEKVKNHLLFYCMKMIQEEESGTTFKSFLKKFKLDVQDTAYINYLTEDMLQPANVATASTILLSASKKPGKYESIIHQFKDSLIYVDLWASWCIPCRQAMPASIKLKKAYKDKKVKFLYLSLDAKYTDWIKAQKELAIDQNSFLLINQKKSELLKQIDLKTIPRYLLYDAKGNLIHKNAPGPDSPELIKLLDKEL